MSSPRALLAITTGLMLASVSDVWAAKEMIPVEVYEPDQLLELISRDQHLKQVVRDQCQIVEDIRYRAEHARYPSFQYLYGDMLLTGTCLDKSVSRGWEQLQAAASQGLPEASERIGRYYAEGTIVQQDKQRAMPYLRQAASQDNLAAQMRYVQLLDEGHGSVHDYQQAYHWLYNALIDDKALHAEAEQLLARLAGKMNRSMLAEARKPRRF